MFHGSRKTPSVYPPSFWQAAFPRPRAMLPLDWWRDPPPWGPSPTAPGPSGLNGLKGN